MSSVHGRQVWDMARERQQELRIEVARERLARQTSECAPLPARQERALAWVGRHLVDWGYRLQQRGEPSPATCTAR